jgi:hypothetical protein
MKLVILWVGAALVVVPALISSLPAQGEMKEMGERCPRRYTQEQCDLLSK